MGEGPDKSIFESRRTVGEICESRNEFCNVGGDDVVLLLCISVLIAHLNELDGYVKSRYLGRETDLFAEARKMYFIS